MEGPSGPMVVTVPVLMPVVEELRGLREKLLVERWPWSGCGGGVDIVPPSSWSRTGSVKNPRTLPCRTVRADPLSDRESWALQQPGRQPSTGAGKANCPPGGNRAGSSRKRP